MNNSVTALMALKIGTETRYQLFKQCFMSFYSVLKAENVQINIAVDGEELYRKKVIDMLIETKLRFTVVSGGGFVKSIRNLIESVETPYFFFMLDDVELLNNKNFIRPAVKAFSLNPKLLQVKFGGGKVCSKSKNINHQTLSGMYTSLQVDEDVVWYGAIKNDKEEYIISQYNSIMRSNVFKDINRRLGNDALTWDSYIVSIMRNFIEELKPYDSGWLNFEDYIYCWGRTNLSLSDAYRLLKT